MNRGDLQRLSLVRIREAHVLLSAGEFSGSYYLGGYAVECALKACIAKSVQRFDFPDKTRVQSSYSHNLTELARVAGILTELNADKQLDARLSSAWSLVINWSEASRYEFHNRREAEALLAAVGRRGNGVLPWVKQRW